ncbi:MAG TPA: hypothetical protein VGO03_12610 [Acidimicrobiia bacterium]|jgi:hypothetical protein
MTRRATTVLLVTCAWTLFVWIVAIKNLVIDNHPAGFRVVHGILAAISIGLGIAVGMIGWRARTDASRRDVLQTTR